MKFNVKALALATGIVFGVFTGIVSMVAVFTGTGLTFINLVGGFHPGYSPTLFGACIMAFWMFVYGLIGGAMLAYIYNFFEKGEKPA